MSRGPALLDLVDDASDPVGQRALKTPLAGRFGDDLDAGVLDHQTDASELASGLRSPAQETEVKAARGSDAKPGHDGPAFVSTEVVPADRRTCSWRI